ncbi:hypothetical protein AgCh_010948 [Apium graveolens]
MKTLLLLLLLTIFNLLLGSSFIKADTDPQDVSALRVLYTSLNSPQQLTKWTANGGDPCRDSWKGISCSGSKVTEIKLSGLGLTGSMGYELTNMKSLTTFDLSNNNLGNQIPYNLPPNLQRLNLAGCGFGGSVPYSISGMTKIEYINLSRNQLQGQLSDMFGSLSSLSTLDLSFNSLTGDLPESFSALSSMANMYLQNNQFTGTINVLANLPLHNLNVGNNRFSGWIPDRLKSIIQREGNSWSSGPAPPPPPGTPPVNSGNRNRKPSDNNSSDGGSKKSGIGGAGVAGIVISILVVGAVIAFFIVKRRSKKSSADIEKADSQPFTSYASQEVQETKPTQASSMPITKTFENSASFNLRPPPVDRHKSFDEDDLSVRPITAKKVNTTSINAISYSIADLQIATNSFNVEDLIGEGSTGRVYRAQFDDGRVLAVKKISSSALPSHLSGEFINMVSDISQLRHPNVAELVGYCSEHGQHLLVYEFYKNGSLHDFLHVSDEFSKPLTWNTRVKIALGTARALE